MTGEAPFRYVIGIEPDADLPASKVAAFDRFYDTVHQREVVAANAGFLSGHRLAAADLPSDDRSGPRWLAFYKISTLAAVHDYVSRQRLPGAGISYTPGPVPWSRMTTVWRAILSTAGSAGDLTLGAAPVLLTASVPGPAYPGLATTFELFEELGGSEPFPPALTAYPFTEPFAGLPGPDTRAGWHRHYRRTGLQP